MQTTISLILGIGAVLVYGPMMLIAQAQLGYQIISLLQHAPSSQELNEAMLQRELLAIDHAANGLYKFTEQEDKAQAQLDVLYRASNKQFTEVYNGVTVAEIIRINEIHSLADCNKDAFKYRLDLYKRTMELADEKGIVINRTPIGELVATLMDLAAEYCSVHLDEVINREKARIEEWLDGLKASWQRESKARDNWEHAPYNSYVKRYINEEQEDS